MVEELRAEICRLCFLLLPGCVILAKISFQKFFNVRCSFSTRELMMLQQSMVLEYKYVIMVLIQSNTISSHFVLDFR